MRTCRVLAAALVVAGLVALPAGPAAAHGGKVKLTVAGDGAGGVTVMAVYADGHRLDQPVRLTLTAEGEGGRTAGPVQIAPAGEGQGFYSSGPLLSPGDWRVTVSAPAPYQSTATAQVQARVAQSPPPAAAARPETGAEADGVGRWSWLAGGLAVVAVAGVALLWWRRRRVHPGPADPPVGLGG
ncbi:hypothetical protein GA0070216_103337 [Micromonospora matsumotoense]|uniref:CopC domain-containing protein n=1 Tax=Micromonospora matsumotoense TaxID=121616 RepID=A0A1C4WGQ6_9ACTN|nr:hypothetical protein [Micromonospora matsumotoense]SCE95370.1 hypothetical protein GA0070216_103337 [Micromonospora matsumotoense]